MWRALLRVALLHLDATKKATTATVTSPGSPREPALEAGVEMEPDFAPATRRAVVSGVSSGKKKNNNAVMSGLVPGSVPGSVPVRHSTSKGSSYSCSSFSSNSSSPINEGGLGRRPIAGTGTPGVTGKHGAPGEAKAKAEVKPGAGANVRAGEGEAEGFVGGAVVVPLLVAMETCGYLLQLWGYR